MKTLVTFFSASGVTRRAAERLAKELGADLTEIRPAVPYSAADLDWTKKTSRSSVEMADLASRPNMELPDRNPEQYDELYIGFPVWWYTAPHIINTFVEHYRLGGKRIHLFATSGGSSPDKALRDLRGLYPDLDFVDAKLM